MAAPRNVLPAVSKQIATLPQQLTPNRVLRIIVDAVSQVKGRAALSHYPSRRLWATRLHKRFTRLLEEFQKLHEEIESKSAQWVATPRSDWSESNALFVRILPILLKLHIELLTKLLAEAAPLPVYGMGDTGTEKTFDDFNRLLNACRQYVYTTTNDSYHLTQLNPEQFNYSVLESLSSFLALAPVSLLVPFMTDELVQVVEQFKNNKEQKFAKRKVWKFPKVASRLVSEVHPQFVANPQRFLEDLFQFSSEFTHVGFVSTLVTSTDPGGVYLGSDDGVFFPSTENYAEVQFMVLKGCLCAFADFYLRSVRKALNELFIPDAAQSWNQRLDTLINEAKDTFDRVGHQLRAWVSNDAMREGRDIWLGCPCQTWFKWKSPYNIFDLYCPSCGTVGRAIRMRELFSYCVLPTGPCDVFGSNGPLIDNLSEELRQKLYSIWEEFREFCKTLPRSDVTPVLLVGDIANFKMRLPDYKPQELYTFVAEEALKNQEGIPIACNCTFLNLLSERGKPIEKIACWACGSTIKLFVLEGDGGYIFGYEDGKTELFDVQASRELPVSRIPEPEKARIIAEHDRNRLDGVQRNSS